MRGEGLLLGAGATGRVLEMDRTGESAGPIAGTDEPASSLTPLSSVAVLPFVDMSPDGDLEYLADGIAEEILNTLAGIRELRVPARTSSFHFKGRNRPIREIAEQLGVSHVLEGSLRKAGERIRVTVQFVDARVDQHLWSRNFDPELDDVFVLQDEIARAVARELRVHLAPGAVARSHPPTGNPAAHDLYLRGLFHWNRRSGPDLLLAIRFFEEATELDPGYARAWAGLALVYAVMPIGFASETIWASYSCWRAIATRRGRPGSIHVGSTSRSIALTWTTWTGRYGPSKKEWTRERP